jgi:ectoine hydroxylase-related dioxygenase (phytanoyl-CoA dioxygenase family)
MLKALTPEQREDYERDGIVFPVPVLSPTEVDAFRSALGEMERGMGSLVKRMDHCHLFFPWAWELATHPAVLDAVEDLLGADFFVHSTRIFAKPPRDPSYVSWHQDGTYSDLNSKPAPSIWIALTDSTEENGCVRVIPGSHHHPKLSHTETFAAENLLNHGEEVNIEVDEALARSLVLRAGELSVHHVNIIHGSNANRSDQPRIGFSISFITPEAGRSHLPVVHARGSASHGFELAQRPRPAALDECLAAHAEFMRQRGQHPPKLK